jgi:uncharacterized membrane protein YgaE (UPF0421/DUF939 family)
MPSERLTTVVSAAKVPFVTALVAGLALFVSREIHAGLGGLWVVITAIVVVQSNTLSSLQAARDRLIGTIVGACVGGLIGATPLPQSIGVALAVLVTALICTIPMLLTSMRLASLTAAIVVLIPGVGSLISARDRFLDTVVGIAVVLVVDLILEGIARLRPSSRA